MNSPPITPFNGASNVECKCCGAKAVRVLVSQSDNTTPNPTQSREQKTFHCGLCNDGWVSTLQKGPESAFGRWLHIPDWEPKLVRTIELDHSPDVIGFDRDDGEWEYFLGGSEIEAEEWFATLESRRQSMNNRLAN